jgi:arylformamidase
MMTSTDIDLFFPDLQQRSIEYNARASVPDFDACVREYAELSAQAKAACAGIYDLSYGPANAEKMDLFLVPGAATGGRKARMTPH